MINDDFLDKCRSLDPSSAIDREKNRKIIISRLEKENISMYKNKRIKKSVLVAAALVGILSLSVVVYAAAPMLRRYLDTQVLQGEDFLVDFWVDEIQLPDGTTSIGSSIVIDHEARKAAGGGAVIVEVDGEDWVILDELDLDNLDDALALLQLENPRLPSFLPEGFAFSRFTFPVNPNNHQFRMGTIPASKHATVYYVSDTGTIELNMMYYTDDYGIGLVAAEGQQALLINGNKAVIISGSISDGEIAGLEGVELYDMSTNWEELAHSIMSSLAPGADANAEMRIMMIVDGVGYSVRSKGVSLYDLVRVAASMN